MKSKTIFNISIAISIVLMASGLFYKIIYGFVRISEYSYETEHKIRAIGYLYFSLTLLISYFLSAKSEREFIFWRFFIGAIFLMIALLETAPHLYFVRLLLVFIAVGYVIRKSIKAKKYH